MIAEIILQSLETETNPKLGHIHVLLVLEFHEYFEYFEQAFA